jgi:hypothetical protein
MEAPKIPSVFRGVKQKPNGFNFTPRYYDPAKEELEVRIKEIEREVALENQEGEIAKARLKRSMEQKWRNNRMPISDNGRTKRLTYVLGGLIGAIYILYKYLLA